MNARRLAGLLAAALAAAALAAVGAPIAQAAARVAAASASALSRELDRDQAMLLIGLASVPLDSGVLILRDPEHLTLRIPTTLLYGLDSATLKPGVAAAAPLSVAIELLKKRRPLHAQIVVYTDNLGGTGINQSLSEQRAQALYAALIAAGIARARLQQHAAGASDPIASNDTPAGRIENRRVEIEFRRAGRAGQ